MQRSIRLNRRDSLTNLVWIGALATAWLAIPAVAAGDTPSMAQFIKMRWPSSGTLTVDGSFYYVHNPDGLYQLYRRMPDSDASQEAHRLPRRHERISHRARRQMDRRGGGGRR
jgi:hypothetical protein